MSSYGRWIVLDNRVGTNIKNIDFICYGITVQLI